RLGVSSAGDRPRCLIRYEAAFKARPTDGGQVAEAERHFTEEKEVRVKKWRSARKQLRDKEKVLARQEMEVEAEVEHAKAALAKAVEAKEKADPAAMAEQERSALVAKQQERKEKMQQRWWERESQKAMQQEAAKKEAVETAAKEQEAAELKEQEQQRREQERLEQQKQRAALRQQEAEERLRKRAYERLRAAEEKVVRQELAQAKSVFPVEDLLVPEAEKLVQAVQAKLDHVLSDAWQPSAAPPPAPEPSTAPEPEAAGAMETTAQAAAEGEGAAQEGADAEMEPSPEDDAMEEYEEMEIEPEGPPEPTGNELANWPEPGAEHLGWPVEQSMQALVVCQFTSIYAQTFGVPLVSLSSLQEALDAPGDAEGELHGLVENLLRALLEVRQAEAKSVGDPALLVPFMRWERALDELRWPEVLRRVVLIEEPADEAIRALAGRLGKGDGVYDLERVELLQLLQWLCDELAETGEAHEALDGMLEAHEEVLRERRRVKEEARKKEREEAEAKRLERKKEREEAEAKKKAEAEKAEAERAEAEAAAALASGAQPMEDGAPAAQGEVQSTTGDDAACAVAGAPTAAPAKEKAKPKRPKQEKAAAAVDGAALVGRRVRRFFDGNPKDPADGTVVEYLPASGEDCELWHIVHEDGDEEDLDREEVERSLRFFESAPPRGLTEERREYKGHPDDRKAMLVHRKWVTDEEVRIARIWQEYCRAAADEEMRAIAVLEERERAEAKAKAAAAKEQGRIEEAARAQLEQEWSEDMKFATRGMMLGMDRVWNRYWYFPAVEKTALFIEPADATGSGFASCLPPRKSDL
ncbi:hypothetical protein CYMTET_53395, partial [Cymbomonas tetramitiformis]